MSGPGGVLAASRADLEDLANDPSRQVAVRVYSTSDGLSTNQMNGGVQPAGALSADRRILVSEHQGRGFDPPRRARSRAARRRC